MKRVLLILLVCMVCFHLYAEKKQSTSSSKKITEGKKKKVINKTEPIAHPPKPWKDDVDLLRNKTEEQEKRIRALSETLHFYKHGFVFLIIGFFVLLFILGLFLLFLYRCNKKISGLHQRLSHLQKKENGYPRAYK